MSATHSNLIQLIELAREPSSEKRRELLRRMTDLFVDAPTAHTEQDISQIGDILSVLAREMEMEVRQTLASRLASLPNAPRNLIVELSNDEIEVARPILTESLALKDEDLVALARLMSQEHLHAIALRAQVSERVTDELVARGNDDVLAGLAGNAGADMSRRSLEIITQRAQTSTVIQAPLVMRPGLPPDLLNSMFFAVSASLKRTIIKKMREIDPVLIDEAIHSTERKLKKRTASADDDQAKADQILAALAKTGPITENLLVTLAKQKRMAEVLAVFAKLTALDLTTARKVLTDASPEALAIAARACRFDRQTFSTLALEHSDDVRTLEETYALVDLYDRIPVDAAQRVMRFWRLRTGLNEALAA